MNDIYKNTYKTKHFYYFCNAQSYFDVLKIIRLSSTHYFVMRMSNKQGL